MDSKYLIQISLIFSALLLLASGQTVSLPNPIRIISPNKCTNFTAKLSQSSTDLFQVVIQYNPQTSVRFNGTSTGNFTIGIPPGSTTSPTVTVCVGSDGTYPISYTVLNNLATVSGPNQTFIQTGYIQVSVSSSNLTIPRGGCSQAPDITIYEMLGSTLNIVLLQINGSGFYLRNTPTNNILETFLPGQTSSPKIPSYQRAICSYYNNTASLSVGLSLSGIDANRYQINFGQGATWNLSVGPVDTNPSFVITGKWNGSQSITATIQTYVSGKLYYAFRDLSDISDPVNPLAFEQVQSQVQIPQPDIWVHQPSDFQNKIYVGGRYLKLGVQNILAETKSLSFNNLQPQSKYYICVWIQQGDLSNTTGPCQNITSIYSVPQFYQTVYFFDTILDQIQRDKLMKWLSSSVQSVDSLTVNLRSEFYGQLNPYYPYYGQTNDSSTAQTLYTLGYNMSTYIQNLKSLFSNQGSAPSSVLDAISSEVGANITSAQLVGSTNLRDMLSNTARNVQPFKIIYNSPNITITNITMTEGNGLIYFGIASQNQNVSQESLMNCQYSVNSTKLLACGRVASRDGQNGTLVFSNLTLNDGFNVYWTATNDYLYRPVVLKVESGNLIPYSCNTANLFCKIDCSTIKYSNTFPYGPCVCIKPYIWSPIHLNCSFDCSMISFTNNVTYENNSCICVDTHVWNTTSYVCSPICSRLENTTNQTSINDTCACISFNIWNPLSSRCEFFDYCLTPYYYDPKSPICILDCTRINFTVTGPSSLGSCICKRSFVWDKIKLKCVCVDSRIFNQIEGSCLPNCSNISHTNNAASLDGICICTMPFSWNAASVSCILNCSNATNTTKQTAINGKCSCISMNSWNPVTFQCEFNSTCPTSLYYYDPSSATCILNCSKISFTVTASSNTDFCPCESNFTWDKTNQKCDCKSPNNILNEIDRTCLPNCSNIGHTNNISYPNGSCVCVGPFVWNSTTETCSVVCSMVNNSVGPSINNQCRCLISYYWDQVQSKCIYISICPRPYFFNNTSAYCQLNCTLIPNTTNQTAVNGLCRCLPGLKWSYQSFSCICTFPMYYNSQSKTCTANCSAIANTNNATTGNSSCVCLFPYKWDNITMSCTPSCPLPSYFDTTRKNCTVKCSFIALSNGSNPDGSCKCTAPYIWNSTAIRCSPPVCPPSTIFNAATLSCRLNCLSIQNGKGTSLNGSCICNNGYLWNSTSLKCEDRCTLTPYTNGQPAVNGSCTCINSSFYYDVSFRVCRVQCWKVNNIDWSAYPQPISHCICANGFVWNLSSFKCVSKCTQSQVWNALTASCTISCSKVANSASSAAFNGACTCKSSFSWNAATKTCDLDCSKVANSDRQPAINGSCTCATTYKWDSMKYACITA